MIGIVLSSATITATVYHILTIRDMILSDIHIRLIIVVTRVEMVVILPGMATQDMIENAIGIEGNGKKGKEIVTGIVPERDMITRGLPDRLQIVDRLLHLMQPLILQLDLISSRGLYRWIPPSIQTFVQTSHRLQNEGPL